MKIRIILLLLLSVTFFACEPAVKQLRAEDESWINGQLCYIANPFSVETDTILCLNNVYIAFNGYSYEYCSYVRNLLSQYGGKFTDCMFHDFMGEEHGWEYLAKSEKCFYPIYNGEFVSLIDPKTCRSSDSIILNDRIIYLKRKRNGDNDRVTRFYVGDFVRFQGSDYMKPKFITDSLTSSGDTLVCFDGHRGPFEGDTSLTNFNPYIFNE